jgi:peptidoglycan hydrolase FlgJ
MTSSPSLLPLEVPITQTPATPHPVGVADPAAVMKAARDFEAMAIGELLRPMFDTVDSSDGAFGGGVGEQAWRPMLVQEYAKQIASHGGLGLAKPIYEAMMRAQAEQAQ